MPPEDMTEEEIEEALNSQRPQYDVTVVIGFSGTVLVIAMPDEMKKLCDEYAIGDLDLINDLRLVTPGHTYKVTLEVKEIAGYTEGYANSYEDDVEFKILAVKEETYVRTH